MKKINIFTLTLLVFSLISGYFTYADVVTFSPDSMKLSYASGSDINLRNVATNTNIATLQGHSRYVRTMMFSPDGTRLASASSDSIILWDMTTYTSITTLEPDQDTVYWKLLFLTNGTLLASQSLGKTVKLWNVGTGENIATLEGHEEEVWSMAFSPDGTVLATGDGGQSINGKVRLWDVETGENIATLEGHEGYVWSMAFSPDGAILASAGWNGIMLWNVETHTNIAPHDLGSEFGRFSPDGTIFASVSSQSKVDLWSMETYEKIATLEVNLEIFVWHGLDVMFSSDGTVLAIWGGESGEIELWNVATHENISTLKRNEGEFTLVVFSPNGKFLAATYFGRSGMELLNLVTATATLEKISGDNQEAAFGTALENPLVVEAKDYSNNLLEGVQVKFTVTAGGGLLAGDSTVVEVTTDANGRAEQTLTLGSVLGTNTVEVFIGERKLATFNGKSVSPYQVEIISGNDQEGPAGLPLTTPLVVEVRDLGDNPYPDVQVTFKVTEGGGLLAGESEVVEVTTDTDGRAMQTLTLGSDLGTNTVEVFIGGPKFTTFNATSISPYKLEIISGNFQQGKFGTALEQPLVVEVKDWQDNLLPNTQVTFTVTDGDALLNGQSSVVEVTTDANGRAAQTLVLGYTVYNRVVVSIGHESVEFSVTGNSSSLSRTLFAGSENRTSYTDISPDGKTLAFTSTDTNVVELWDVETHTSKATFDGHTGSVWTVSFSSDGTLLASGSADATVKLWDVEAQVNIATFEEHTSDVNSVAFSPDGKLLASGGWNGVVKVWDVETKQNIATFGGYDTDVLEGWFGGWYTPIAFSPDGTLLVYGAGEDINFWDVETKQNIATIGAHPEGVISLSFSPDGTMLASNSADVIKLWNVETRENISTSIPEVNDSILSMAFFPNDTILAFSLLRRVILWDVVQDTPIAILEGHTDNVWSISFSPDGLLLASSSSDGIVKLWDTAEAKSPRPAKLAKISGEAQQGWMGIPLPNPLVVEVRDQYNNLNPGGQVEFSVTEGGGKLNGQSDFERVTADADGRARISLTLGHTLVNTVEATPLGGLLAQNQSVVFTITLSPYIFSSLQAHNEAVYDLSLSPDGKTLATGSLDNTVKLWDMETKEYIGTLEGHSNYINAVSFSPDGMRLASCSGDNTVRLWDMETHTEIATLGGHERSVLDVAFSPDGTRLASGGRAELNDADGQVKLWDVETQTNIATLEGHTGLVWSVAFSSDGKTLATASSDATVKVWDVDTHTNIATLEGHEDSVLSVAFSLDGKTLATGSSDNTVKLWDVATRTNIATLEGHTGTVWSVAFSSDGKTLATASSDATVKVWDVDTHTNIAILEEHTQIVWSVAFSPDGKTLISGSGDGTVKFWDMSSIFTSLLTPNSLAADVNGDGVVNMADMVLVASNYGQTGENAADINGDGIVHIYDILLVAAQINTNGAAPALHAKNLSKITSADIEKWLTDAQQLDLTDATSLKGILFLEQLLTALTPKETALLANFPNPFNPETWIPYQLAKPADVTLTIYAMNGQVVRRLVLGHQAAGMYQNRSRAAYWDGRNALGEPVASGVYFYTLTAGDFAATRKMLIRK